MYLHDDLVYRKTVPLSIAGERIRAERIISKTNVSQTDFGRRKLRTYTYTASCGIQIYQNDFITLPTNRQLCNLCTERVPLETDDVLPRYISMLGPNEIKSRKNVSFIPTRGRSRVRWRSYLFILFSYITLYTVRDYVGIPAPQSLLRRSLPAS